MSLLAILTDNEQKAFDHPPTLTEEARAVCFHVTESLANHMTSLRKSTNKVGFLLQYGYFKACKRFFTSQRYRKEDIQYVAAMLGISMSRIDLTKYVAKIPTDHQKTILKLVNHQPFEAAEKQWVTVELQHRIEQFTDPRALFFELVSLLHDRSIEIPSYHRLSKLITRHYLSFENKLLDVIQSQLTKQQKNKLDTLLLASKERSKGLLSNFKIINQSTKPKAIQASLNLFEQVRNFFLELLPIIDTLKLTPQTCQYYATWVKKAKLSQIKQFPEPEKKYLHLIAFIQHQYYLRQDTFVDIFLKCVQSAKNTSIKRLHESDKLSRNERCAAVKHVTQANQDYRTLIDDITEITRCTHLTDSQKIQHIDERLTAREEQKNAMKQEQIELFEQSLDRMIKDKDYFDVLEKLSIKLQRKVSGIVNALCFNPENSSPSLIKAIDYFASHSDKLSHQAPDDFLSSTEKAALAQDGKNFRVSLYKILLFIHLADGIKSGELNLSYSYRYLSIQDYLVDEATWQAQRDELLDMAGLTHFKEVSQVFTELKQQLDGKYHTVNQRHQQGRNPYLSIDDDGRVHVTTPTVEEKETEYIAALLEQNGYVPILRVLSDINEITGFSHCFKHHSIKHVKRRPNATTLHAGIIGLGCNIGVPKMAQISPGVNENTLTNAVHWYFSRKALRDANQRIVELIHQLNLSRVFVANTQQEHGASDGSKFNVSVESLWASQSFKYFGKDKGISVYTFIDERQALFHSLVMSASEREAAYVLDGLNNHDVPNIDIHSTDTHGYTESIFAALHMQGISFAPRLKRIDKQYLYAFSTKKTYQAKGYQILPSRTINQQKIKDHWEAILRFMVTIKLKKVTASQLFKRLSSYAKDNPLYKAIKELGRITKSLFILSYFDDVVLRQRIEKQLSRIELSNKFANAVFYANNAEFSQSSLDEQEIAVGCKTLIQNCIILWNYLYLSQLLINCADLQERQQMADWIKAGSVMTWRHINLHGEFDFRRHAANENTFNMDKILALKLA